MRHLVTSDLQAEIYLMCVFTPTFSTRLSSHATQLLSSSLSLGWLTSSSSELSLMSPSPLAPTSSTLSTASYPGFKKCRKFPRGSHAWNTYWRGKEMSVSPCCVTHATYWDTLLPRVDYTVLFEDNTSNLISARHVHTSTFSTNTGSSFAVNRMTNWQIRLRWWIKASGQWKEKCRNSQ